MWGVLFKRAHAILNHIVWCLLCKQIGMQIAFVCFFSSQSFSDVKALVLGKSLSHTHTRGIMFCDMRELDKPQMNVLPPSTGLIFSWLSQSMCAQINQTPCSNQSHLYHPANK